MAKYRTLDASIPPIAHRDCRYTSYGPGATPSTPLNDAVARRFRLYYAAAVSWVDSQVGRVLDELIALRLTSSTIVALQSDHGWSLGEQG